MASDGLYIHIPFCRHKCSYCDFYSVTQLKSKPGFLAALQKEISLVGQNPLYRGFSFSTIYFGGGTPSLLTPVELSPLLNAISQNFPISSSAEISLEINPGAVSDRYLAEYRKVGINRLIIGVQSFHDSELNFLTRIHNAEQAEKTIQKARDSGFENIGLDLIFGIPGQSLAAWRDNVEKACELPVQHVSMYGLTYEPGTRMTTEWEAGRFGKCDEELERDMYLYGKKSFERAGYEQYEISNFARPGFPSRHNQKYWDGSRFLGLGPSANSFDGTKRWANAADVENYAELLSRGELPKVFEEIIDGEKKLHELVMLGLRQKAGMSLGILEKEFGITLRSGVAAIEERLGPIDPGGRPFESSDSQSLLCLFENRLCLTQEGLLLYDTVCAELAALFAKEG